MKPTQVLGHMLKVAADLGQLAHPKPQPTGPVQPRTFQPEIQEDPSFTDVRTQLNRNKLPNANIGNPILNAPGMQFPHAPFNIAPGAPKPQLPVQPGIQRPPGIGGTQLPSGLFKTSSDIATAPGQQDTNATAKALGTPPVKNTPIRQGLGTPMAPPPIANGGKLMLPSAATRAMQANSMKQIGQYNQSMKTGLTTGTSAPIIPDSDNTQKTEAPIGNAMSTSPIPSPKDYVSGAFKGLLPSSNTATE